MDRRISVLPHLFVLIYQTRGMRIAEGGTADRGKTDQSV